MCNSSTGMQIKWYNKFYAPLGDVFNRCLKYRVCVMSKE